MISAVVRAGFLNLRRDRAALILSFIVPIVFFSIFAGIFGAQRSKTPRVTVAVADEDHSARSKQLVDALRAESALKIVDRTFDAKSAEAYVRKGVVLVDLRQPDRARDAFEYVIRTYPPDSAEAIQAKQQLDRMRRP